MTLRTFGTGCLDIFVPFGIAGASGRAGTIDWDRGTHRKQASEGSGAPIRAGGLQADRRLGTQSGPFGGPFARSDEVQIHISIVIHRSL